MALEYKQQTFCKFASIDTPNDTDALDLVSDPEGHPV